MDATMIVALTGAATGVVGIFATVRSWIETRRRDAVALEAQKRDREWGERGDIIEDLSKENARVRGERDEARAALLRREESCDAQQHRSAETIALLTRTVQDEVASAAGEEWPSIVRQHRRTHDDA